MKIFRTIFFCLIWNKNIGTLRKSKVRFFVKKDINEHKTSICNASVINYVMLTGDVKYLAHARMLRRIQIVFFVFEQLGVEVVNFYNFQHNIFSECSVLLSPEYVILNDFCSGVSGQGKLNQ